MSADLYLNAMPDTAANRSLLAQMARVNTSPDGFVEITDEHSTLFYELCLRATDRVHIGEVSYLKAAVMDDATRWIPGPVNAVLRIFGDEFTPLIANKALSATVTAAMSTPDHSHYRTWHRRNRHACRRREVKKFFARATSQIIFPVVE